MSVRLWLTCLSVTIGLSLSSSSSFRDLYNYTRKVDVLHDMLKAEGCGYLITKGLQRREILGGSDQHDHKLDVQVQKELYRQLKAVLVECRSTVATAAPTECQTAHNLTEAWRQEHNGGKIKPKNGYYNCDSKEMIANGRPWFRFSGSAGNRLMNKCVPRYSCGTATALWSDDTMPTQVGVVSHITAYGRYGENCRSPGYTMKISLMRCSASPHDFVYKFDDDDVCSWGFCGMTA